MKLTKINLNKIIYLPLIFFFLPAFGFVLFSWTYTFFFVVLYIVLFIILILDYKHIYSKLKNVIKITPLKILLIMLALIVNNSIFLSILGITTFKLTMIYVVKHYLLCIFPIIIYFVYIIDKYINNRVFFKSFIFIYWVVLNIGFLAYIGQLLDLDVINNIFDFFANTRLLRGQILNYSSEVVLSNFKAFGIPRLDNLYEEPSHYAQLLFLIMPLSYSFVKIKNKVFKNRCLDIIIKKTIVLYTWISLILTQSPIYLVFAIIISVLYFFNQIIFYIKKNYYIVFFLIGLLYVIIINNTFENSYIYRIINVLTTIRSFDDFIAIEASLATRVVCYINAFMVFVKHPLFGVGLGNLTSPNILYQQYLKSPVSLTPEIEYNLQYIMPYTNKAFLNKNFIYIFCAENGILIFCLLIYFCFTIFKNLKTYILKFQNNNFYFNYLYGLNFCFIALIIDAFYDLYLISNILLLLTTWIIAMIFYLKKGGLHEKNNIYR